MALPGFTKRQFHKVICFIGIMPGFGVGFDWLLRGFHNGFVLYTFCLPDGRVSCTIRVHNIVQKCNSHANVIAVPVICFCVTLRFIDRLFLFWEVPHYIAH